MANEPAFLQRQLQHIQALVNASALAEAQQRLRTLLIDYPQCADAHNLLGIACFNRGQVSNAIAHCKTAIAQNPNNAAYHNNLGCIYQAMRRHDQAIACYKHALASDADHLLSIRNIIACLLMDKNIQEANTYCRKWIELEPKSAEARLAYGNLLAQSTSPEKALEHLILATELGPFSADAFYLLGGAFLKSGRVPEAIEALDRALAINDDHIDAHSLSINALGYSDSVSAEDFSERLRRFNRAVMRQAVPSHGRHANQPDPERVLRIGYLLPDLLEHSSLSRFVLPIFKHHDRRQFEIYGYYNHALSDLTTQSIADQTTCWQPCHDSSDVELAATIVKDKIDILIDLVGHFSSNRLRVLAMKPAPVSVSWFGYPGHTGLENIDYKFSDAFLDPGSPGRQAERANTLHLAAHFCFEPPVDDTPVRELPALHNGFVTFAAFGNRYKINPHAIAAWSAILNRLPDARLMIGDMNTPDQIRQILDGFSRQGIPEKRLILVERKSLPEFLELHHSVDIALDTYPFTGGLTSLLGIWMGLPFITQCGDTPLQRQGAMILAHLGLESLIAHDPDQYVAKAVELASDLPALARLRQESRDRLLHSPLTDAAVVTRSAEEALRRAWRHWCRDPAPPNRPLQDF